MPFGSGGSVPANLGVTFLTVQRSSYLGGDAGQVDTTLSLSTIAGQALLAAFGSDTGAQVLGLNEHGTLSLRGDTGLAAADPVLEVRDETNALVFQVRNDGSLHGKTGKALTFDL